MAKVGSVRLSRRTDPEDIQDAVIPKAKRKVVSPEQALYGIFGPQYASALNASANGSLGETARMADRIELRNRTQDEARRYSEDLAAANAAQQRIADTEGYYGILGDVQRYEQGDVDRGMGGARKVVPGPDGHYGIIIDPTREQVANANQLNTDQAERFGTYAGAIDTLRKAGVNIPDSYLGPLLTPPTQREVVPVHSGTTPLTPSDQTQRYEADEGLTADQQIEIANIRQSAADKGDDIQVDVKTGEGGVSDVTYKGTPEALMRNGIDPNTGKKLRPNIGEQGGGSPMKPAADVTIRPNSNAVAVATSLFPGIHITENRRDPNSKLGRENPDSWHNKSSAAIDVRPIKDLTFEQYVKRYEDAGYPIIEKIDEVKHPSKHATGPHWHVVLGERRDTSQMYAARLKTSPLVESATPIGDGSVVVKLKSGEQRVYKNGRRVG